MGKRDRLIIILILFSSIKSGKEEVEVTLPCAHESRDSTEGMTLAKVRDTLMCMEGKTQKCCHKTVMKLKSENVPGEQCSTILYVM